MRTEALLLVVDTHTGGEPTRIVLGGLPPIPGRDIKEKLDYVRANLDWVRKTVLLEPRGHMDSFGALVLPPSSPGALYGLIFMDTSGYLYACGHATMGVAKALVELGYVRPQGPEAEIPFETAAGLVRAKVKMADGHVGEITLVESPSFLLKTLEVEIEGIGSVEVDVAFGGNFFALARAEDLGVRVRLGELEKLIELGLEVREAVNKAFVARHPEDPYISGVGLTLIYEDVGPLRSREIAVFGQGQFDRSPCGTGTAARMASLYARGEMDLGDELIHESVVGSRFRGRIIGLTEVGGLRAVVPEVSGKAHITAISHIVIEPDDEFKHGFSTRPANS